jgi:Flp pilus assembly protein TadG
MLRIRLAVKRGRRRVRNLSRRVGAQQGQAYIETLLLIPMLITIIVGVAYLGRVYYAKIAAEVAAYDCTRASIAALSEGPHGNSPGGQVQGVTAARQTLSGFYLNASTADIRVAPIDAWGRGQAVQCDVRYRVDLSGIPFLSWIMAEPVIPVWGRGVGQVEAHKSQW